jgi:hypothetical protein
MLYTSHFQISFIFAAKTTILLTNLYVTIIVLKRKIDENKRWYIQGTWDKNGETKITLLLMHKLLQVKLD